MNDHTSCLTEHSGDERIRQLSQHLLDGSTALLVAEMFKALSDPTRVRIISLLSEKEMCVGELCHILGMAQPAVSHQLRLLRTMKLVNVRKEGRHAFYVLSDDHIRNLFKQGLEHVLFG
ncbi:MAG: metalloregulator ArsR/SmtB family transcription factor [Blastocatellia bacterium]|nr:metalloregulator ArsR/SmtB family transcription factor [Blastocatellia bacterium]